MSIHGNECINLNKKIALILPYFGELPNYFNLWAKTASLNKNIDFIVIGDKIQAYKDKYENIKVIYSTFEEVQKNIKNLYGKKVKIENPYKLCDYRPAYGEIFSNITEGYRFWGWCDPDIIWGDINHFLTKEILDSYDRFYFLGHLSIFKNNNHLNTLFRKFSSHQLPIFSKDYKIAFSTNIATFFDEKGGVAAWFPLVGVSTYSKIDFADIAHFKFEFKSMYRDARSNSEVERFLWEKGKLFRLFQDGEREEVIYLHLQKRFMDFSPDFEMQSEKIFIKPNLFAINYTDDFWRFNQNEKEHFEKALIDRRRKIKLNKLKSFDFYIFRLKMLRNKLIWKIVNLFSKRNKAKVLQNSMGVL